MPPGTVCLFEPSTCAPTLEQIRASETVLSKVLLSHERPIEDYGPDACRYFDRRIFIRRDPRDLLVSHLLYAPFELKITSRFPAFVEFVSALKAKEQHPRDVSFLHLLDLQNRLAENAVAPRWTLENLLRNLRFGARVLAAHGDAIFVLDYEDLVEHRLGELQRYLGFNLAPTRNVAPEHRRVARSRGYGDWRHWFTAGDLTFLREKFYGFVPDDADWKLAAEPVIPLETSSGYVDRLARERGHFSLIEYKLDAIPARADLLGNPLQHRDALLIGDVRPRQTQVYPERGATIIDPHFETMEGRRVNVLIQGETYGGVYEVALSHAAPNLSCWMTILDSDGAIVHRMGTGLYGDVIGVTAPARLRIEFPFPCHVVPHCYFVNAGVTTWDKDGPVSFLHRILNCIVIIVAEGRQLPPRVIPSQFR